MGLYLYDAFGNLNLLYRDPAISSSNPDPAAPRPRPAGVRRARSPRTRPQEGRFLLQDVYQGLEGVPRGSVKWLRVVAVPPKVQPHMNQPILGVSREDPGKFAAGPGAGRGRRLGLFPRAQRHGRCFFQAVDAEGLAVQTMRSLTYVGPGQTLACVGCHESREAAPAAQRAGSAGRPARAVEARGRSGGLMAARLRRSSCSRCSTGPASPATAAGAATPQAERFDLTAAKSYDSLLGYADKDLHEAGLRARPVAGRSMPGPAEQAAGLAARPQGPRGPASGPRRDRRGWPRGWTSTRSVRATTVPNRKSPCASCGIAWPISCSRKPL